MSLLIVGGTLVDPANGISSKLDILIEDGKIARVGRGLRSKGKKIDARGLIVAPGFIDMHVHLREPGREDAETIESGAAAAAAGGFTSIVCMPNTEPINDSAAVTRFIIDRARQSASVNVYPCGAISRGAKGEALAEIGDMVRAGAVAISDDGRPVMSAQLMRRAMEYSKIFDLTVIDHCEDQGLSAGGSMHEGFYSTMLGLRGMAAAAEELHVARDALLAAMTGARVHIAHISTALSVEIVRQAKKRGVKITAEATPHHFTLNDSAAQGYDPNTKVNPPLRPEPDRLAIIAGLADGTIDAIASDHAPHTVEDKMLEFESAPFGIVGLETAVSLALDRLVRPGHIGIERLVELMSVNPARILRLNKGHLSPGSDADITILDLKREVTVDPNRFRSRSRNTPFAGWKLKGAPVMTIVGGRVVWQA